MTTITDEDITKSATLSSISLEGNARETIKHDLETIIEYINQLSEVSTEGVEPTYAVHGLEDVTREDVVIDYGVSREALLQNAPKQLDNMFEVPQVLDV